MADPDRIPFLLGVAGGTGSGKTTVTERLCDLLGANLALVKLDGYYLDRSHLPFEQRIRIDYDHPDAFDWALLRRHVASLHTGDAVDVPRYDFTQHVRSATTELVRAAPVVVIEGILVLHDRELRDTFDLRVFVDTDADVRFIRRLQRDVRDRGRTYDSVIEQYLSTVRPGHLGFVEPSKRHADIIIPHGGLNQPAFDMLLARMRELA